MHHRAVFGITVFQCQVGRTQAIDADGGVEERYGSVGESNHIHHEPQERLLHPHD